MVPNTFWCDLCKIVVFVGLKGLLVDFGEHLFICVLNG